MWAGQNNIYTKHNVSSELVELLQIDNILNVVCNYEVPSDIWRESEPQRRLRENR